MRLAAIDIADYTRTPMEENLCLVYLDGVLQKCCVALDTEKGELIRYKLGEDGNPEAHPNLDEWATETVYGKIELEKME